MKATLRVASIALLILTAATLYAVAVIGTGEKLSAPAVDEAQASYLTPAAAETLAMYAPPPGPATPGRERGPEHAYVPTWAKRHINAPAPPAE